MGAVITVHAAIQEFLVTQEAAFSSASTVRWYRNMLGRLDHFAGGKLLSEVTPQLLTHYAKGISQEERAKRIGRETCRDLIRALKRFFNWAANVYSLSLNPAERIVRPHSIRQLPKALTPYEIQRLLDATENTPIGKRDRAIIYFLSDTGCRAGGLLSLTKDALNLEQHRAVLTEKGGHSRVVPFTPETGLVLREWLVICPKDAQTVFCSMRSQNLGDPLGETGLQFMLRRLARKAGLKKRVFAHAFRHTLASEYTKSGGQTLMLREVMGHSDVRTTQGYVRVDPDALVQAHRRFSPVNYLTRRKR
jgi:site-specific recombinase XerD